MTPNLSQSSVILVVINSLPVRIELTLVSYRVRFRFTIRLIMVCFRFHHEYPDVSACVICHEECVSLSSDINHRFYVCVVHPICCPGRDGSHLSTGSLDH
jgi:hypothetical protein